MVYSVPTEGTHKASLFPLIFKIGKWMPGGNQESVCSNVQILYLCVMTN